MDPDQKMKNVFQLLDTLLVNESDSDEMKLWKTQNLIYQNEEVRNIISKTWSLSEYQDQKPFENMTFIKNDLKKLLNAIRSEYIFK